VSGAELAQPQGAAALHPGWPEARWNVSGLFVLDRVILGVLQLVEQRFAARLPIESIHGAPAVPWNGGRRSHVFPTLQGMRDGIGLLNGLGIGVLFTFSNHRLTREHLGDPTCNRLLELIDDGAGRNGVIVSSDLLAEYVAERHPTLRRHASAIKVTVEEGQGDAAYYAELGARFDRYVVHPDDGFDAELLARLDPERAELLVNEPCVRGCRNRVRHYELIAAAQLAGRYDLELNEELTRHEQAVCRMPLRRPDERRQTANLTRPELEAAYGAGLRHFKLQGRTDLAPNFVFDLVRYALEPEHVGPLAFKAAMALPG